MICLVLSVAILVGSEFNHSFLEESKSIILEESTHQVKLKHAGPFSSSPLPLMMILSLVWKLSHCSGIPESKGSI
jgi:hypothetical protein